MIVGILSSCRFFFIWVEYGWNDMTCGAKLRFIIPPSGLRSCSSGRPCLQILAPRIHWIVNFPCSKMLKWPFFWVWMGMVWYTSRYIPFPCFPSQAKSQMARKPSSKSPICASVRLWKDCGNSLMRNLLEFESTSAWLAKVIGSCQREKRRCRLNAGNWHIVTLYNMILSLVYEVWISLGSSGSSLWVSEYLRPDYFENGPQWPGNKSRRLWKYNPVI